MNRIIEILKKKEVILFFIILFIYLLTPRYVATHDGAPNAMLPVSIISELDFYLDDFINEDYFSEAIPYSIIQINGKYVSLYYPGTAIIAAPLYVVPVMLDILDSRLDINIMSRFSASILSALAAVILFLVIKKYVNNKWAIILTSVYAFGTCQWVIASQDLWKNTATNFLLTSTIFLLLRERFTKKEAFLTGIVAGMLVVTRQLNVIFLLFIGIFIIYRYRKKIVRFTLGLILPITFLLFYQKVYLGSFFNLGYGSGISNPFTETGLTIEKSGFIESFFGLFISPARGLFIYSPILIFSIIGIVLFLKNSILIRSKELKTLLYLAVPTIIFYALITSYWKMWWGGTVYGYRMIMDLVPFLILFLIPLVNSKFIKKRLILYIFTLFFVISMVIQFTGLLFWDASWVDKFSGEEVMISDTYWDWKDNPIIYYLRKY